MAYKSNVKDDCGLVAIGCVLVWRVRGELVGFWILHRRARGSFWRILCRTDPVDWNFRISQVHLIISLI